MRRGSHALIRIAQEMQRVSTAMATVVSLPVLNANGLILAKTFSVRVASTGGVMLRMIVLTAATLDLMRSLFDNGPTRLTP